MPFIVGRTTAPAKLCGPEPWQSDPVTDSAGAIVLIIQAQFAAATDVHQVSRRFGIRLHGGSVHLAKADERSKAVWANLWTAGYNTWVIF